MSTTVSSPVWSTPGWMHWPTLGKPKVARHGRADGGAERSPRVRRQAGGDVDGEDRRAARVHGLDRRGRDARDGRVQPGAEQRVDDGGGAIQPAAERCDVSLAREALDLAAAAAPSPQHERRVAAHLVRRSDQPHLDRDPGAPQMARDDEAVAAVVAPAAHDDDRPAPRRAVRAAPGWRRRRRAPSGRGPGVPCSMVQRSSARISAAVVTIMTPPGRARRASRGRRRRDRSAPRARRCCVRC